MLNLANFKHHKLSETIVNDICTVIGTTEKHFFRSHLLYYFSLAASCMRIEYLQPASTTLSRPVATYAISLAPSGFGKGYSTEIIEDHIINKFRDRFLEETWPVMTEFNIAQIADFRARKYQLDPDVVRARVTKEFENMGGYQFAFTKPTDPSIGQLRRKLLMAGVGSINLQVDEIGLNFSKIKEAMPSMLELYDGKLKNNLVVATKDRERSEMMFGRTPATMMMFGVPGPMLDEGKQEDDFIEILQIGCARRCNFVYVTEDQYNREYEFLSSQQQYELAEENAANQAYDSISEFLSELADPNKVGMKLGMSKDTAHLLFDYKNWCKKRAIELPTEQHIERIEVEHRFTKAIRAAATYAFVDNASEIAADHLEAAILFCEESGEHFSRIMHRDPPCVKLANYLGSCGHEMTKVSLRAKLPFFKGGTKATRDEMLVEAIDWGYTNNISIKRRYSGGVEFYSGKRLESNDLSKLIISHSSDRTENYQSETISWDKVENFAKHDGLHWINHELENGFDGVGYRNNENCIAGFNMVVIDADDDVPIQTAQSLLKEYKAFYYTTKRHTPESHRYRIVLPINYTLKLDANDFAAFMENLYRWLPFQVDEQTGQRSRKWLTNKGHYLYTDGALLDALPFIPGTDRQIHTAERLVDLQDLGGIERWFILNTSKELGNRNNNLIRYALMLVDGGMDLMGIQDHVFAVNNKLDEPLLTDELIRTVMRTAAKRVGSKVA